MEKTREKMKKKKKINRDIMRGNNIQKNLRISLKDKQIFYQWSRQEVGKKK